MTNAGCAAVISHDRFLPDRICTHMLTLEGDAHVEWCEDNFENYVAEYDPPAGAGRGGAEADQV